MRISDWQIIWAPGAAGELLLLDLDETLDAEIRMPLQQLTDVGRPDFAVAGIPVARGNRRRTLEFAVRAEHASVDAAWLAVFRAIAAAPWAKKATIRITPRGGDAVDYPACLLRCRHEVAKGGGPAETVHEYAFRLGGAITP